MIDVRVTGPLLQDTYEAFGPLVMEHLKDAPAAVIRFDTALHMIVTPPKWGAPVYHPTSPPQAIVVMRDHLLLWLQHAENLWQKWGIVRTVWPSGRQAHAYRWADQMALRRQLDHAEPIPSGPIPLSE